MPSAAPARLSRETRRLLLAIALALVALWGLARIRFPDRPAVASPVPPLLSQLALVNPFDDLASELGRMRGPIESMVSIPAAIGTTTPLAVRITASTFAFVDTPGASATPALARDPASGLVVAPDTASPSPVDVRLWRPRELDRSRVVLAARSQGGVLSIDPVFLGRLEGRLSPVWATSVWQPLTADRLEAGVLLFTTNAELMGVAASEDDGVVIVPAQAFLDAARRLADSPRLETGWLGVTVALLTPSLARATGAEVGVVVAALDEDGPAARVLRPGDVIESADTRSIRTPAEWTALVGRWPALEPLKLLVWRAGERRVVDVVPVAAPLVPATSGLSLVTVRGEGSRVTRVVEGSIAERAGLRVGDLITRAARTEAPAPDAVRRAIAAAAPGLPALLAVSRDDTHVLVAVEP